MCTASAWDILASKLIEAITGLATAIWMRSIRVVVGVGWWLFSSPDSVRPRSIEFLCVYRFYMHVIKITFSC